MEVFNSKQHWQEFKDGTIAVNCKNESLAVEFLDYCVNNGLNWHVITSGWKDYEQETCYSNNMSLGYSYKSYYHSHNYKIVEFQGIHKGEDKNMEKTLLEWIEYWKNSSKKNFQIESDYKTIIFNNKGMESKSKRNPEYDIISQVFNLIGQKYKLIEEPVTLQEAMAAFENGETIKCIIDDCEHIYEPTNTRFDIVDINGVAITTYEILKGIWYIVRK